MKAVTILSPIKVNEVLRQNMCQNFRLSMLHVDSLTRQYFCVFMHLNILGNLASRLQFSSLYCHL